MLTSLFTLGLASLLTTTVTGAPLPSPSALTVRDGSIKKGVAYENPAFVPLFGDKVGWCYNWVSGSKLAQPINGVEFVPMLHSDEQLWTNVWEAEFKTAYKNGARHVLSFNEPDQCGGGGVCMQSVSRTVNAHKTHIQSLIGPYSDVKIGSPAVTNGVRDASGNIMGVGYLKEFLSGCFDCRIDFLVAHWYGPPDVQNFLDHIQAVYEAGDSKKKVWVTEFAPNEGDDATKANFVREAIKALDGLESVERYAYHYATQGVLVDSSGNGLSALGSAYVG